MRRQSYAIIFVAFCRRLADESAVMLAVDGRIEIDVDAIVK